MYPPGKIILRDNVPEADRAAARKELSGYYAHCTVLDDCMDDLLAILKEAGLDKDTIVVFTSDHGDMIESHGQQRKRCPWEESACVPMLFHFPGSLGIEPCRVVGTINSEDVMPTLLSLCGLPIPETLEGFNFSGYMQASQEVLLRRKLEEQNDEFLQASQSGATS